MGGIEPARACCCGRSPRGASVVTANKALLAQDGPTLYAAADEAGVDLYFEAAVAGAIPIVRPVRESLAGDRVTRVLGIVNGTTNYVLDKMASEGLDLDQAVKEAQALGYAEADPTADVEGYDAAAKAAILASLAFHTRVSIDDVSREGITSLTADDVLWAERTGPRHQAARDRGARRRGSAGVQVRVHPALVPVEHPLAGVRGAYNAVFVEAEAAGELMFYGRGAGGQPTASAVLGDVVSVARHRVLGGRGPVESALRRAAGAARRRGAHPLPGAARGGRPPGRPRPGGRGPRRRTACRSRPSASRRSASADADVARLVITTHAAPEHALRSTVEAIAAPRRGPAVVSVLRVEGA